MTDPIVLAPRLDITAASDLLTTLRGRTEAEVVVDLKEVKHLGALCLQVLLSAAKSLTAEERKIKIINTSDRVLDQMRVMGMTPEAIARGK
jgi:chemotaxis protein CheX